MYEFGNDIRMIGDQLFREYVVTPAGIIKTCYFERNVACALLHIEKEMVNGRCARILDVRVSKKYAGQGYVLLRDLYAAEEREQDYKAFLLYQDQAKKREIPDPIDDAYLPEEVLRRRTSYVVEQRKLDLPKPQGPRKSKKVAESRRLRDVRFTANDAVYAFGLPLRERKRLAKAANDREAQAKKGSR